jgi:hypothetical protein
MRSNFDVSFLCLLFPFSPKKKACRLESWMSSPPVFPTCAHGSTNSAWLTTCTIFVPNGAAKFLQCQGPQRASEDPVQADVARFSSAWQRKRHKVNESAWLIQSLLRAYGEPESQGKSKFQPCLGHRPPRLPWVLEKSCILSGQQFLHLEQSNVEVDNL